MIDPRESIMPRHIVDGLNAIVTKAEAAEREAEAARREIEHVLGLLPYGNAKTGKYRKLRRRLERFLSERLEGL